MKFLMALLGFSSLAFAGGGDMGGGGTLRGSGRSESKELRDLRTADSKASTEKADVFGGGSKARAGNGERSDKPVGTSR